MGDALLNTFEQTKDTFGINAQNVEYMETCQKGLCNENKPYTVDIETEDIVSYIPLDN